MILKQNVYTNSDFYSRLTIDTPEKLAALRNGTYDDFRNVVFVTSDAGPNVLSLPNEFSTVAFLQMHFIDGNNKVYIHPEHKFVGGSFTVGENVTLNLPTDYEYFALAFGPDVTITNHDIENIMQWKKATQLEFFDYGNLAERLAERIWFGVQLSRLERLTLIVRPQSFKNVEVSKFIDRLSSVVYVRFKYQDLDREQIEEFRGNQKGRAWWAYHPEADSFKCIKDLKWAR